MEGARLISGTSSKEHNLTTGKAVAGASPGQAPLRPSLISPRQRLVLYLVLVQPNVHQPQVVPRQGPEHFGVVVGVMLNDVPDSRAGQHEEPAPAHPDLDARERGGMLVHVCS